MQDLDALSDDELYELIGAELARGRSGAKLPSREELVDAAKAWMGTNLARLKSLLCGNRTVRELVRDGRRMELIAAVSALVESAALNISVAPIALLLCRGGLERVCSSEWTADPEGRKRH